MRKRTVKFLIESVLVIVICLTPLCLYALQLVSSKDLAYGETDNQTYTTLDFQPIELENTHAYVSVSDILFLPLEGTISFYFKYNNQAFDFYSTYHLNDNYRLISIDSPSLAPDNIEYRCYLILDNYFCFSFNSIDFSMFSSGTIDVQTYYSDIFLYSSEISSVSVLGEPVYTLETFMTDFCDIVFLDQSNVFYQSFDYFFGQNSIFGLGIFSNGALLYIAYVCTVYLAWLVFEFLLFIPKLARKWMTKFTTGE